MQGSNSDKSAMETGCCLAGTAGSIEGRKPSLYRLGLLALASTGSLGQLHVCLWIDAATEPLVSFTMYCISEEALLAHSIPGVADRAGRTRKDG